MTVPRFPLHEAREAQAAHRRRRSVGITLVVLGAGAAAAFAASQDGRCRQNNPDRPQDCRSSGSGGHGVFSGGGRASESSVSRGGFGGAGYAHAGG
jgi:hypothetical protein